MTAVIPGSKKRGRGDATVAGLGLGVSNVNEVDLGEPRVQGDVHQTKPPLSEHRRNARNLLRIEHTIADDSQPSWAFCDEDIAVREEGERPRAEHAFHRNDTVAGIAGLEHLRPVGQGNALVAPDGSPKVDARPAPAGRVLSLTTKMSATRLTVTNRFRIGTDHSSNICGSFRITI